MAVDLGKARTGIAICDKLEMLSSPLTQISEYNRERLLEKISNLAKEKKAELIAAYGRQPGDTGSPEVQIAILTERIRALKFKKSPRH